MKKILHAAIFCQSPEGGWGLPVLLHGEPAVGKTANVKEVSNAAGLFHYRISPGERGEGQFGVVPVPGADGFLDYPPPRWASLLQNGGVLFVDEINTAAPALQSALLGLVQLRTIGAYEFPSRVRIIGAGNNLGDNWDLRADLANRFCHLDFEGMSSEDWAAALLSNFASQSDGTVGNAEAEEARVLAAWPKAYAVAAATVSSFVRRHPGLLHKRPERAAAASSLAWPSRRSCHYAATAFASALVHNLSEIDTDTFMAGFVGLAWVQEFATFRANLDLPDPSEVLDGKVIFKHDPRRLDRSLVTLGACATLAASEMTAKKLTNARGNKAWEVVTTVLTDAADCAVPAARTLIMKGIVAPLYKAAEKPCDRLWPLISASGMASR
jgi:hypothetical protein